MVYHVPQNENHTLLYCHWCASYRISSSLRNTNVNSSMAVEGEEGSRRTGDLSENPLLAHLIFVKMEDIMDKLKLLHYEAGFCKKFKFKPFARYVTKLVSL